ncbi:MAG TPA: hypothetical protein PK089_08240 [Methanoregulaceae archaeon]|nr:hypothetical protein [Methanoregulaceae archaeon]HQJ88807.1 hypothetical protein [Methanoregulaceae archaeon]
MIARDSVRLGAPVSAGGRLLTPVVRVRYTLAGTGGFGSVEPLGLLVGESGETTFYPFDPSFDWDRVSAALREDEPATPSAGQEGAGCGTPPAKTSDLRTSMRAHIAKFVTITRKYISFAENPGFGRTR